MKLLTFNILTYASSVTLKMENLTHHPLVNTVSEDKWKLLFSFGKLMGYDKVTLTQFLIKTSWKNFFFSFFF